jgi:hypothetical protein
MRPSWARRALTAAAILVAVSIGRGTASQSPTLVFLLAGQSNMAGLGPVRQLPRTYRTHPANVLVWRDEAWVPLVAAGWGFGPEISFGSAIAAALPTERIGIVKVAATGAGIDRWSPQNAQSLYATWLTQAQASLRAAPDARVAGALWVQGERDARAADTAAAYGGKLRALVAAVRRDVDRPDLPFLCAQVNPPLPFAREVRAAQAALAAQVPSTVLVSTDGLGKWADKMHYDSAGQVELGRRFARAYLKLVGALN